MDLMDFRRGLLLLVVLVSGWTYSEARSLMSYDIIVTPVDDKMATSKLPEALKRDEQLCTLCEEFTAQATNFLAENKTQADVMHSLHQACSRLHTYEQQCVILVDYYASLFFKMISTIRPEEFCTKVNLCVEKVSVSLPENDDTCTLCHRVLVEVLMKLRDPDAQLEVIEFLLKECNKVGQYSQECKRLVFRYGPLILINGEKFLETTDVCASIHACIPSQVETNGAEVPADASRLEA